MSVERKSNLHRDYREMGLPPIMGPKVIMYATRIPTRTPNWKFYHRIGDAKSSITNAKAQSRWYSQEREWELWVLEEGEWKLIDSHYSAE